ncbi:glutathione binding-like protein (plasmid) [Novosphingobium sp. BL-8A]|uniref:glutathione binding-like protein n=1 Tax=Novosphingobium sp. BL-8A TaxID=3127639 RepID=UPI00375844C8
MKLYYSPGACSLADHIALVEGGLPFEPIKVDLKTKTVEKGGDFKKINPKGYVPVLELDDGSILTENVAILSYIAERASGLKLPGEMGKFRVLEALAYISTELHKGFKPFFSGASDEDKERAREVLTKRFAFFDAELAEQDFAAGENFTVADCYLFVMLFWAKTKASLDLTSNLSAYYGRLSAREGVRKALADEGLG